MRIATYNVLADGYLRSAFYARSPEGVLDPAWRHPAVAARTAGLAADVVCLQEAEAPMLSAIASALPEHTKRYAQKPGRADGVAVLSRAAPLEERTLRYPDDTGRVALFVVIPFQGRRLGVVSTHLKFDEAIGLSQAEALTAALSAYEPRCDGWVVCGDLNAVPESAIVKHLVSSGLTDSHAGRGEWTSNFAAGLKRIDFLLCSRELEVAAEPLPRIDATSVLPSRDEPSDHLPVVARVAWR